MSSGAPDFTPTHPKDDQFYRIIDVKNPSKPVNRPLVAARHEAGRQRGTADASPGRRHPGFRPHNTNVYPERPDRAYLGYIDGGMVILDISDKSRPKMVSRWDYHPPYHGFTHTVVPFFDRNLLIVSDECVRTEGADWPKLVWVVDGRAETNPVPIATCPLPPLDHYMRKGAYGAHNLYENLPKPNAWKSDRVVLATF